MYNPGKHHRKSIRLNEYSYSQDGLYYTTICIQNRHCLFGEIIDKKMILNNYGKIAMQCWQKISQHFLNAVLHEYIIMPNHIHGIIEIRSSDTSATVGARHALPYIYNAASKNSCSLPENPNRFQNQGKNTLSAVIGSFKSAVSKQIHEHNYIGSIWQRNFWEHIIKDEQSYKNISQYIIDNPADWADDELYV